MNSPGDSLSLYCINSDWNELSVTWSSRPAYDLAAVSSLAVAGEANIAGWREWSGLENTVSGWLQGANWRGRLRLSRFLRRYFWQAAGF